MENRKEPVGCEGRVSDNGEGKKGKHTPTDFMIVCAKKKKKSEPLENVLTCMVGSIHFPGQEKKKVPVVHRSGDSELNPGEISCKYPASVVSPSTRYAQCGSVHLLQEWNEEQIIVMSPLQMYGCRNPVGFP